MQQREEDIPRILRELEINLNGGENVVSSCHAAGISDKTYYVHSAFMKKIFQIHK